MAARDISAADAAAMYRSTPPEFTPRTPEQEEVWKVLRQAKASDEPMCITLTGPAACGKTVAVW